jgi:hypothetical protein
MRDIYSYDRSLLKSLFVFVFLLCTNLVFSQPVINSFSPASGAIGTTVTITGNNFNTTPADNTVYFGYVKASVLSATATTLTVTVPSGATYQPISVTTNNLTAYSQVPFNVTFPGIGTNFAANSFATGVGFSTGQYYDVCVGDVDGDGKNDVITANADNSFSVFRNTSSTSSVSFAAKVDYLYPMSSPYAITLADFDGDGKLDLAFGWGPLLSVYRNNCTPGTISFTSATDLFLGNSFYNMVTPDLDGDGKPDLALADGFGLTIIKNNSTGSTISFAFPEYFNAGNWAQSIAANDLDGDGKQDLVIALNVSETNSNGKISIFRNTTTQGAPFSASSLAPKVDTLTGGTGGFGVKIADLDGDGKADIIASNNSSGNIAVFKNTCTPGNISLAAITNYSTGAGPGLLSIDDLDGDGKADIIIPAGNKVGLMKNTSASGNIALATNFEYDNNNTAKSSSTGDLDGDGKPELIIANSPGQGFTVFRNKIGEPTITASGSSPVTGNIEIQSTVDASVQLYNGAPYVQRHYDILPDNNAASATGTITLYFTQQEFDNFNATAGHGTDLPTAPTDATGKANLRIYQYHGTSTTGLPGSYTGSAVTIDPDDNNIVWNAATQWWAVTFDVVGFSGFFASNSSSLIPLPVTLLDFNGTTVDNNTVLKWKAENEAAFDRYEIEYASDDAGHYTVVGKVFPADQSQATASYEFIHKNANSFGGTGYYRLKMIDLDGSHKYSRVVTLQFSKSIAVNVNPTLIKQGESIRINVTGNSTNPYRVIISNISGQVVDARTMYGNLLLETGKLQPGTYFIKVDGEAIRRTVKVIIL